MNPATLTTIINNAPMILQGANKLIRLIRERNQPDSHEQEEMPVSVEGLQQQLQHLQTRLDANAESDVEQIRLIEQLARQNEALAASLDKTVRRLNTLTVIAWLALAGAVAALLLFWFRAAGAA